MPAKRGAGRPLAGDRGSAKNTSSGIFAGRVAERKQAPRLRGDRNQCPTCGELFNSTKAFDRHRIGRFGIDRRCRTEVEMRGAGMSRNAAGFWITEPFTRLPGKGISGDFSTPEVSEYRPEEKRAEITLGRCVCGAEIASNVRGIDCPTCSAWARWRSAFRVAVHALRGPQ